MMLKLKQFCYIRLNILATAKLIADIFADIHRRICGGIKDRQIRLTKSHLINQARPQAQ